MTRPADWIVPDWPAPSGVCAFITTRAGGVSTGPYASFNLGELTADDPAAVQANKRRLDALLPAPPRWLRQVHGARVVHADMVTSAVQADAAYTGTPGVVCAVKIADCMPVLIADRAGTAVAAAHAGWRGLAAGVVENAIAALPVAPDALIAYLGPAIGPSVFEVGDEVRAAFCDVDAAAADAFQPLRPGKWLADLFRLGRQRLARCGVAQVHGGGLCTYSDPERFYSHRRSPVTGRMAALIWIGERRA
jgi:polyphenol oxidase